MRSSTRQDGFSLIDILVTIALIGVVAGIAVPMTSTTTGAFRMRGDAQAIANVVSLAKMRASARFTRTRVRADLANNSFRLEVWQPEDPAVKTVGSWVTDGGDIQLSTGVTFGFADRDTPPPDTQVAIGQSSGCTAEDSLDGAAVDNTACIVFNSRGIPIDGNGDPTGGNALYVTDGGSVYATTITATPLVRQWWSSTADGGWVKR